MRILTSCYTLDPAGLPTFTLTMYKELMKRGHQVIVYSPKGGKLASEMIVKSDLSSLIKYPPDIILAQHLPCSDDMHDAFPDVPIVYYAHGLFDGVLEEPPKFECNGYIAINREVKANLIKKGIPEDKITIIRDFIDLERFKSVSPIHEKLTSVLFISNYKKWINYKVVRDACLELGISLRCIGSTYGRVLNVEDEINKVDLVVSWARGILEGMACGRNVISWDNKEGDGFIDEDSYYTARENNFSGRIHHIKYTAESMAQAMRRYDSFYGHINRAHTELYHDSVKGVDEILEELKKYV
jgi:hypothetical protein